MGCNYQIELLILDSFWIIEGEVFCAVMQIGHRIIPNIFYGNGE